MQLLKRILSNKSKELKDHLEGRETEHPLGHRARPHPLLVPPRRKRPRQEQMQHQELAAQVQQLGRRLAKAALNPVQGVVMEVDEDEEVREELQAGYTRGQTNHCPHRAAAARGQVRPQLGHGDAADHEDDEREQLEEAQQASLLGAEVIRGFAEAVCVEKLQVAGEAIVGNLQERRQLVLVFVVDREVPWWAGGSRLGGERTRQRAAGEGVGIEQDDTEGAGEGTGAEESGAVVESDWRRWRVIG